MKNIIFEREKTAVFYLEPESLPGVKKIAEKVVQDFEKVCGAKPEIVETVCEEETVIFAATVGHSPLLEEMERQGRLDLTDVRDKWEVFSIQCVEKPMAGVERALVIAGSDKRGTIYGLFQLSELIGVTPFVYFGDAAPEKYDRIQFIDGEEQSQTESSVKTRMVTELPMTSREPSVKFRGFFINDEWPCFGNWTFRHFGGFNADMYDHVFELLLRMKGNYLWPAMWTSSFFLDGPGMASMDLADEYGVIIGNSHHEPCMRASEEWDKVKGEDTPYGTAWNYKVNKEGLLNYWADGLK